LADLRSENRLLVAFICNHCPYVKATIKRLVADAKVLQQSGIGAVAINSDDYQVYPEDSPEKMCAFARLNNFSFPYLIDREQSVAKDYGAVCTPDFLVSIGS